MTCQRCGVEAERGLCPGPCKRQLCVTCYDKDQEETGGKQKCRINIWRAERNETIRALRSGGMPRKEIAKLSGLSIMTISRVMRC